MRGQSLESSFPEAWREFWKRRILCWLSWLTACALVIFSAAKSLSFHSWPVLAGALAAVLLVGYTRSEMIRFNCPRCHKQFFWLSYPIFLQSACRHCALPKYEADQEV